MFGTVLPDLIELSHRQPDDAWFVYTSDGAATALMLMLTGVSLAFVPGAVRALWSRERGEAGGLLLIGGRGDRDGIQSQIVRLVRARKLSLDLPFDAGRFLWSAGAGLSIAVVIWAAVVAAAFVFVWEHDRATDTLYTENWVETGDFWSAHRIRVPYAGVEAVELGCVVNDDGKPSARYQVTIGGRLRHLARPGTIERKLDDYLKVDEKLRAAGVAFAFRAPEETWSTDPLIERACVAALGEGLDEAARAKIERLFHLDEWFERRWRARTRPPPLVSTR